MKTLSNSTVFKSESLMKGSRLILLLSILLPFATSLKAQLKTQPAEAGHTALPTVKIMTDSFFMPQLNRYRRIWICLPKAYASKKDQRWPVIYMHDGQNVFDAKTSYAGEWGVDECLDTLEKKTGKSFIVVAVDNGATKRIDEYTPWKNLKYGGGEGSQYSDFMTKTLKPYIDQHFRTLPDRENTAIIGSSLGGLISLYTATRYPAVYGKVGNFSPAYWIVMDSLKSFIVQSKMKPAFRIYTFASKKESPTIVVEINAVDECLQKAGIPSSNMKTLVYDDGEHKEWFWRREFPKAVTWLFGLK